MTVRLDRYVRETGAKKGRVIEDALDSYLSTLDEVPAEYVVPCRVVLTDESFDGVLEAIGSAAEPTATLRDRSRCRTREGATSVSRTSRKSEA